MLLGVSVSFLIADGGYQQEARPEIDKKQYSNKWARETQNESKENHKRHYTDARSVSQQDPHTQCSAGNTQLKNNTQRKKQHDIALAHFTSEGTARADT